MQQFVCTVAVTELRGSPEVKRRKARSVLGWGIWTGVTTLPRDITLSATVVVSRCVDHRKLSGERPGQYWGGDPPKAGRAGQGVHRLAPGGIGCTRESHRRPPAGLVAHGNHTDGPPAGLVAHRVFICTSKLLRTMQ